MHSFTSVLQQTSLALNDQDNTQTMPEIFSAKPVVWKETYAVIYNVEKQSARVAHIHETSKYHSKEAAMDKLLKSHTRESELSRYTRKELQSKASNQ